MYDKGVIIKEIQDALDNVSQTAKKATSTQLELPSWWTDQVMTALCRWGLKRKFSVYAAGMQNNEELKRLAEEHEGKVGSEWLYDFTCLEYGSTNEPKQALVVAECEWANIRQICYDFKKLLLARAEVRIMIFNGNYFKEQGKVPPNGLGEFRKYITNYKHTCTGDTYLFAARLHEDEDGRSINHRFDYYLFVA